MVRRPVYAELASSQPNISVLNQIAGRGYALAPLEERSMSFVGAPSSVEFSSVADHDQVASLPPTDDWGSGRADRGALCAGDTTPPPAPARHSEDARRDRPRVARDLCRVRKRAGAVAALLPTADVFAVVDFMPKEDRGFLQGRTVRTSFIQRLPGARRLFRHYLGLMPIAVEQHDLSRYDLIISSSHAVAKGVLTGPDQIHISYVHSPMRYIWDLQHQYLSYAGLRRGLKAMYVRWLFSRLREWDVSSSHHVDHFIANSEYIARRIKKTYRRDASVIHPPVDVDRFQPGSRKDDFFLLACPLRAIQAGGDHRRELQPPTQPLPDRRWRRSGERMCARGPRGARRTSSSRAWFRRRNWST